MKKGKLIGKVFGIALIFVVIGLVFGSTLDTANAATGQHPEAEITATISSQVGNTYEISITFKNHGEESALNPESANGVQIQIAGADINSVDKGSFDEYLTDFFVYPSVLPNEYEVVEFYSNHMETDEECTASLIITTSQGNLATIKYRGWITDKDDTVFNPSTNQYELYIARDPIENSGNPNNPPYNKDSSDFTFLDYDGYYLPVYETNPYNTNNDATWIGCGWTYPQSENSIRSLLDRLRAHRIYEVYLNVGGADANGNFLQLNNPLTKEEIQANCAQFMNVVEDYSNENQCEFQVLAWVSGGPEGNYYIYDITIESVRENIAQFCGEFAGEDVGFDGIHYDYEFWNTEYDSAYLQLLDEIRGAIPNNRILSVDVVAAWLYSPWSGYDYVRSLAESERADELVLMAYDSGRQYESYREWVRESTNRMFEQSVTTDAEVIIGIPTYDTVTTWHKKGENLAYALLGVMQGANSAQRPAVRISIYDNWETSDYDWTVFEVLWHPSAIQAGLRWLRENQNPNDGSWYSDPAVTSFAVLTMLNWGFDESDEIVSKGINYVLSKINPDGSVYNQPYRYTYYTSIAILPLAATGNADYHDEIQKMRDWLIGSQWDESSFYGSVDTSHWYYGGFGYGNGERPDNSNTQWALVGIKAADRVLGLEATDTYAKAADYFLERCRNADGGSGYTPGDGSIHTMTAASVWSYSLCGRGSSDAALAGIQWLTDRYSLTNNDGWGYWSEYYYKVTLAKALTMTHKVKLGEHDWFEELAQKLAEEQYPDGNWPDTGMMGTEMSTCWAIMALQTRTLPPSGEFGMWATLESHCDLHMYDFLGRHTGVNYITGTVEENIPGSDFKVLDPDGNEVPYSGSTPDDGYRQVIELSELLAGSYRIELVATSDGPYHLTVVGLSDGDQVTTHTFEGTVEEGDRLATSVTVTSMEGALTLLYEPLISLPVLGVDPTHLDVVFVPDTISQAAFTVSETGGNHTLHDVTMYCTDIIGVEGLVHGADVTSDINDFDVDPGDSQVVNVFIPVPVNFEGPGAGSIVVESIDGGTREITLTLLPIVTATIDFAPDVLNREAKGKYVTAYIELPPGYDVSQIDISSIRLNSIIAALTKPTDIGDHDSDGIPDLMVKFDMSAVQAALEVGDSVDITITGEVAGISFEGGDIINRVITPTPPGHAEWTRVTTPTIEGFVLAPNSVIVDYAVGDDGAVAYAIVYSYDTSQFYLLKSTDYAATWGNIMDALEEEADGDINWLVDVATDSENADFVAVALEMTGPSVHVLISDDGGATFEDAGEVEDDGVYFPDGYDVSDLEVSPEVDGGRNIAIGGRDNHGDAALFRCNVTGGSAADWEDTTGYVGWDDEGDFTSILVTDIIFSPNWSADKTILVTTVADYDPYDVYLQSGSWGTTPGWNEWSTLGIEAVPIMEDVDIPMWLADFDARRVAGMTLPQDYYSRNSNDRVLWVWVNYYDDYTGDPMSMIMKVDDDSAHPVGPMGQIEDGELWLTNVSYQGTIAEGKAIAGVLGSGTYDPVYGSPDDLIAECCEGVQVYRNDYIVQMDICCVPWFDACKPPTGQFAMEAFYVGEDKAYAVSLWGLFSPYDEDAWSVTFDNGDTWNQLSLIDTHIDYLSDVAVSPDCNKTMLASVNEESSCECDSVWLHAESLTEAPEYSGKWLRTWCGQLEGNIGGGWERGLLRLAPEETTGDNVYFVDYGTNNVYWNDLETLACWENISCVSLAEIVDLAVQDSDTVYALDYYGDVAMFDEDEWQEAVTSEIDYGWTIAVQGDHILVGGCDSDVSYSDDGGETFSELEDVPVDAVDYILVTVAFDSYFDANDTVYAAAAGFVGSNPTTGGVYRWVIGGSQEWEDFGAEDYAYTGLVLNAPSGGKPETSPDSGGVLYASYVSGVTTGVARCLTPAQDMVRRIKWDYLTNGLTSELFKMTPDALKICGGLATDTSSKLFAIDSSAYYDMVEGLIGTVWSLVD